MSKTNINNSRRDFLKFMGVGAIGTAVASACGRNDSVDATADDGLAAVSSEPSGTMTYRINHNTGDKVSLLGYGCMRLPTVQGASSIRSDDAIDQDKVNAQVDHSLKHGINYFDTSPAYCRGLSEAAMGIALSRHPRDSYFIATKLSNFNSSTWPREKSIEMFENSLRNLQTDYIDYLLLHSIGGSSDGLNSMETYKARYEDNGILDWLVEQKEKGRIRNLGFSYHGDIAIFDHLLDKMDRGEIHWDFVQIQHNYVDWSFARDINPRNTNSEYLYEQLAKRNIPAVVMEPLLGGRLAEVPRRVATEMKKRRPADSVASWAFRFAGTQPGILTVLSGMTYDEHLNDNLKTFSPLEPLTDEEKEFLNEAAKKIVFNESIPCTACSYCMPCPYGVDIPGVFEHYNKCINDDNVPRSMRDANYAKARRVFLGSYAEAVAPGRNASRCIGCNHCVSHCPQGIDIPDKMHQIDGYITDLRADKI
ncbi:MAG: aldo/keto reductase [Muribaculaceae bacterium]|nr:aldo/keto reductase [Muribaculaceae bacterium]